MTKLIISVLLLAGCSSITIEPYTPNAITRAELVHAQGSYSAGAVSGQTRVESDQLIKSSLPCRLQTFQMPDHQPVNLYIENALKEELRSAEKLSSPEGRKIDIMIVKLESDTSKIRNGRWTLDFKYQIGKITRDIVTTTDYAFDSDSTVACRNTAAAFDDALRENFAKFFKTLN